MRPPNPRLADNGNGPDYLTVYTVGIDPDANADAEGNWIKAAAPTGRRYLGIVTPNFATGLDADGTELSLTTYSVMVYCYPDPGIRKEDPLGWRGLTLVAQGDAVRGAGGGCWAFNAVESGPDAVDGGLPYEG
jgi:hypothetical protein